MVQHNATTTTTTTLYEAAEDMLRVSMLVYTLAFLRGQARQPDTWVRNASELLELPLSLRACRKAIEANMDEMMERRNNSASSGNNNQEDDNPHYQEAIGLLYEGISKMGGGEVDEIALDSREEPCLVAFGDEREQTELVYAIGVNPSKKRIVVAFRGSVTKTDWKTDASVKVEKRKNPLLDCFKDTNEDPQQQQPATIGYHAGFYRYLFEPPNNEGETKAEEILQKVLEIYDAEEKRDYSLYVTGHSLGGALSTLFAFFVASKVARLETNTIPTPIICVSLASPRPGDVGFQSAFESLERTSLLRHLRVVNEKDPVTRIPVNIRTFRHTGVKLKLRQRGMRRTPATREGCEETENNALDGDDDDLPPFEIRYSSRPNDASEGSGGSGSIMNSISADISESTRDNSGTKKPRRPRRRLVRKMIAEQHSCKAYCANLLHSKDTLHQSGVTLDGLYDALVDSIKTRVGNRRTRRLHRRQKVLKKFPLLNRAFGSGVHVVDGEDDDSSEDSDDPFGTSGDSSNSFLWSSGSMGSDEK